MLQIQSLACWSDVCVFPQLLWTESALLLQNLLLLLFELRVNLGTFGRLVAVILGLIDTYVDVSRSYFLSPEYERL